MNTFEKETIKSALDIYNGIKGLDVTAVDELKDKVDGISDNQCFLFKITDFIPSTDELVDFDYSTEEISNIGDTLAKTIISNETNLTNIVIKSLKWITDSTDLVGYKIERCINYSATIPVWTEIGTDELYHEILDNTTLRFRITIPATKMFKKLYMIYSLV